VKKKCWYWPPGEVSRIEKREREGTERKKRGKDAFTGKKKAGVARGPDITAGTPWWG